MKSTTFAIKTCLLIIICSLLLSCGSTPLPTADIVNLTTASNNSVAESNPYAEYGNVKLADGKRYEVKMPTFSSTFKGRTIVFELSSLEKNIALDYTVNGVSNLINFNTQIVDVGRIIYSATILESDIAIDSEKLEIINGTISPLELKNVTCYA